MQTQIIILIQRSKLYPTTKQGKIITNVVISPFFDTNNEIIGFIGQVQDITEQSQIEAALREGEERLRAIIDQAPFGAHIYRLDADDRLIFNEM